MFFFCFIKQHARRVYEILRLLVTDMSDAEQYRSYRLDIKRRLISPYKVGLFRVLNIIFLSLFKNGEEGPLAGSVERMT